MSSNRIEPSAIPAPQEPPARKTLRPPPLVREVWKKPVLRSLLLALAQARLVRPASERCAVDIECYPGIPYHRHALWKVAHYAGARLVPYRGEERARQGRRPKLRLFWPDTTAVPAGAPQEPAPPAWWRQQALNGRIGGDSKRRVEELFALTFGYSLAVDPLTHRGPCVAKSDRLNGAHDGRVLMCPIAAADPSLVYEVLVDNRVDEDTVVDFRAPVVGGEIPLVYVKQRPLRSRFSNANGAVAVAAPEAIFSADELAKIRAFAQAMGLELGGEVDVLRDVRDGRLYIVDANGTSWGPPRPMPTADAVRAVRAYAAALTRLAARAAA